MIRIAPDFELARFSDLGYEGISVEIRYRGMPVAQLNQDKGPAACELVVPSRFSPADACFALPLDGFMDALSAAKALLAGLD